MCSQTNSKKNNNEQIAAFQYSSSRYSSTVARDCGSDIVLSNGSDVLGYLYWYLNWYLYCGTADVSSSRGSIQTRSSWKSGSTGMSVQSFSTRVARCSG